MEADAQSSALRGMQVPEKAKPKPRNKAHTEPPIPTCVWRRTSSDSFVEENTEQSLAVTHDNRDVSKVSRLQTKAELGASGLEEQVTRTETKIRLSSACFDRHSLCRRKLGKHIEVTQGKKRRVMNSRAGESTFHSKGTDVQVVVRDRG